MTQKTIRDSIAETQTIFKENDYFTADYLPETIQYYDNQINKILYSLKDRLIHDKNHIT